MKLSNLVLDHTRWLASDGNGTQIDLQRAALEAETLRDAVLQSAIFEGVVFEQIEFVRCDLTAASFFGCSFVKCQFTECELHKTEFHNCTLTGTRATDSRFTKPEWYGANLQRATFTGCDVSWSSFLSVDLRHASLQRVNLEGSVWDKAKTYGATFEEINLGTDHAPRIQGTSVHPKGTSGAADELLKLPAEERLQLAEELYSSVPKHVSNPGLDKSWADEIRERIEDIQARRVEGRAASDVFADVRARLASRS